MTITEEGQPAHGPAVAGHGKRGGLLNGPHREMIIVVCSVIGVGLTYMLLRRSSSSGTAAAQTTSMSYPGSSSVLTGGQVAGFDQNAVYGLQTMLANQGDQLRQLTSAMPSGYGAGSSPSVPKPIAGGLFAPSSSDSVVRYNDGGIFQVQPDGSLFGLSMNQYQGIVQRGQKQGDLSWDQLGGNSPAGAIYNTGHNLAAVNTAPTP